MEDDRILASSGAVYQRSEHRRLLAKGGLKSEVGLMALVLDHQIGRDYRTSNLNCRYACKQPCANGTELHSGASARSI